MNVIWNQKAGSSLHTNRGCCRTIFVAARDNNLPAVLSYIHVEQRTPMVSMVFTVSGLNLLAVSAYICVADNVI